MYPKCSLNGYSTYLQIFGLLALVIIIIISGIYYMRVYHENILEKYADKPITKNLDLTSKEYKNEESIQPGDRSTYPLDKYPGAELVKTGDTKNKYNLRECKVYFTEDIAGCDAKTDNGATPKTCSYTFDGWQEFDTYTDKSGKEIKYPKKIFNDKVSNTNELVNSYFTSKCFKEFDNNGLGNAQRFEYKENDLIKYDSKGLQSNTEKDTNRFGGKKYTSIQFLNSGSASDNFKNLIDSICSIKYTSKHGDLNGKQFYKFLLNGANNITKVIKVKLNSEQSNFDTINDDAILDFASSGQRGLRFNKAGSAYTLQVFIKSTNIKKKVKVYKFTYATNLCSESKVKSFTSEDKTIEVSNFVQFSGCSGSTGTSASKSAVDTGISVNILNALTDTEKDIFIQADTDFTQDINNLIDQKRVARINILKEESKANIQAIEAKISGFAQQKLTALANIDRYVPVDKTFLGVIKLKNEGSSTGIFDYKPGYINTNLEEYNIQNIQDGVISENFLTDGIFTNGIILTFPNLGDVAQKIYSFIVPGGITYTCDILLVGGGGAGGNAGGSGGGGDVLEFKNLVLNPGNYNILVGDGGNGKERPDSCSCGYSGRPGNNTSITIENNTITAAGGGGGGSHGYEHGWDGGRGWVWSGYNPSATPTAKYIHPQNKSELTSSGGGGGGAQGANGGSGNSVSGNGGKNDDNNGNSGGGGGGAAPPNEGGNGANSSITGNSYNGNGGKGIVSSITGKNVEYGGGGASARWNGEVNRNGVSSGGGGYQIWPTYYNAIPMSGGGGVSTKRGGSGVVIIKVYKKEKEFSLDELYKKVPPVNQLITISSTKLQLNIITSFVFLQKGYYRFRADIGSEITEKNFGHPNIKSAWLGIYDESTKGSDGKYKYLKVFKYNDENKPSYLIPYLYIDTNKFYKLIYFYVAHNISQLPFNLWYTYSITEPTLDLKYSGSKDGSTQGYSEDIVTSPAVKSTIIGVTDRYILFTYTGETAGTGTKQSKYTFKSTESLICDILIVAGGGAGGRNRFPSGRAGGGGGAGGFIYLQNQSLTSGTTYVITVGDGGDIDDNGNNSGEGFDGKNSSFGTSSNSDFIAIGGGGGGTTFQDKHYSIGRNGGSGGGAGAGAAEHWGTIPGGNSITEQGFKGGGNRAGSYYGGAGAGGGGAGGEGNLWQNVNWDYTGAKGGVGKSNSITGVSVTYAKGGDGGRWDGTNTPINGEPNTGNGGDGTGFKPAGKGGSGIVIIRYRTIGKISKISEKTQISIPTSVTIKDSEKYNNDNNMYEPQKITDIKDVMNSYLFSGTKPNSTIDAENNSVYQHYISTPIKDIFSTITYKNDNANEWKNFQTLAYHLNRPSINFFKITEFDNSINTENVKLSTEISNLDTIIDGDSIVKGLINLSTSIKNIDYNRLIGTPSACLKPNININAIVFEDSDKTYDKISIDGMNTQDLLTPNLVSSIYIEAI